MICLFRFTTLVLALSVAPAWSCADTITFEGFTDGTIVTTQYPGVTLSNAIVLTAGVTLNEFEFPPHSGTNVVSDSGGPISISFVSPMPSFGGYFTYSQPLTIAAFNSGGNEVASVGSLFSNNEALSGDPGSSPNEFLNLTFATGISKVTITGDPSGGSFAMDDASFGTAGTETPEPSCSVLVGLGILSIVKLASRGKQR